MKYLSMPFLMICLSSVISTVAHSKMNREDHCMNESLKQLRATNLPENLSESVPVSIVESIVIELPIERAFKHFENLQLDQLMTTTEAVSGVEYTLALISDSYRKKGDKRLVCLIDGYGALEELKHNDRKQKFSYRVWHYTLPVAQAIAYADGTFYFYEIAQGTQVVWEYSFTLKDDTFPGNLGVIGRWLFAKTFVESDWKDYMHQALLNLRETALK